MKSLRDILKRDVSAGRPPVTKASQLQAAFYTSPEIYDLEKEKIFYKHWLCVGRVEELRKTGDFFCFNVVDRPIILVKDDNGAINAYSAICRHRGAIIAHGSGNTKHFICPFHEWTYDISGKLVATQYMDQTEDFEPLENSLEKLQCSTLGGFIFINCDHEAPGLAESWGDLYGHVLDIFRTYHFEELRLATRFFKTIDCNWKIMAENAHEHYHTALLHRDTLGAHASITSFEDQVFSGGVGWYFKGGILTPDGRSRFGPMKWLSGREVEGSNRIHIWPNISLSARPDLITCVTSWPMDVDRGVYHCAICLPPGAFDDTEFDDKQKVYKEYLEAVLEEDVEVLQSVQQGLKSGAYKPGRMSRYEILLNETFRWYLEHLSSER